MIGDWVRMKENQKIAFQMEDISGTGMFKRWTSDGEYMVPYAYDEIEPIPLTPEILEKNGFKKTESDTLSQTWAWTEKSEKIYNRWVQITFYNEPINGVSYLTKIETCSSKGDGVNHFHSCDIESVHELQHALKLCGINLEIKL